MKWALILTALFAIYATVESQLYKDSSASDDEAFKSFKQEFNRNYETPEEEANRFTIFKENRARVRKLNKEYRVGIIAYKCALNQFADMKRQEYRYTILGLRPNSAEEIAGPKVDLTNGRRKRNAPVSFDWRSNKTITPAQNQGRCGSSFSFAAVAAIEAQFAMATGKLIKLSDQQAIACSKRSTEDKCRARSLHRSLRYFINTKKPLALAGAYPYTGQNGVIEKCEYDADSMASKAKVTGFVNLHPTEENLLAAVYTKGAVAGKIDADQFTFMFLSEGVYNDQKCAKTANKTNHWVLIIGYGTTSTNQNFWVIKNSMGSTWGFNGFCKMARGINQCCVGCNVIYPIIDEDLAKT